jgi:hypothetical protein
MKNIARVSYKSKEFRKATVLAKDLQAAIPQHPAAEKQPRTAAFPGLHGSPRSHRPGFPATNAREGLKKQKPAEKPMFKKMKPGKALTLR